jgi:hypothetical protein
MIQDKEEGKKLIDKEYNNEMKEENTINTINISENELNKENNIEDEKKDIEEETKEENNINNINININEQKKENDIEQIKDIKSINPIQLLSCNNITKINNQSINENINGGNNTNNITYSKNKNMIYVKNQNKSKYNPKNENKNNNIKTSPLYTKINRTQNQTQQKPLKTIKILDKKNNVSINDIHLAKSANNSKNKFAKIKLGQSNNPVNKNKMRLSPIINNKKLKISLSNSQKRLSGGKINTTKKIKIQEFKNDNSAKNIKDNNNNNFPPNKIFII